MTLQGWKNHPERVSSMKNMTRSELSRRRLAPKKPPSPIPEPAGPAEPAAAAGEAELDECHEGADELENDQLDHVLSQIDEAELDENDQLDHMLGQIDEAELDANAQLDHLLGQIRVGLITGLLASSDSES